jgi:chemosensory pili system protein ChpA (sensor histidine kinase/response regulator)
VTRARMVPVGLVFSRLRLPIREAAERAGKDVQVVQDGEDVSLDKTIADALLQPMLHLVRNAVWHGVESPDERARMGKAPAGAVRLRARQESGQIVIEVADDGAGLDLARLRARGVELGLLTADVPIDDPSVKELVFAPGLSTAAEAGHVSGRGVGGDVVRRTVERLNGSIRVETEAGRGTSFLLTLPLTLAITKAMLVREAGRTYAVPMYFAERLLESGEAELVESPGLQRIKLGDSWLGVTSLAELLGTDPGRDGGPVLSLRVGDQRLALRVGEVLGQEEIVVKDLGPILGGHRLFAGITLRGSGDLVLILDVPRVMEGKSVRVTPTPVPAPRAAVQPAGQLPMHTAAEPARRRRVLFVDDSISVRKVAERTFRDLDVELVTANDGVDALAQLSQASFDIVFTDLEMPRMHGYELIRELRFLPQFRELPVVVVTSRSAHKHKQHAADLGANQYLTKPFTAETIKDALDRWTGARSGR